MNRNKFLRVLFFLVVTFAASSFFIFHDTASQQNIKKEKFSDGVERWYRVKSTDAKPWLFKQIEAIFNVIIDINKGLPFGKSVAFLVGVSQYHYISPQLPFVENDLNDMREFLLNTGGFDEVYIARGDIVNRDLVEQYLKKTIRSRLNTEDRLLFYYAGHGDDDGGNTGYMQFSKATPGDFFGQQVLKISDAETWCSGEIKIKHLLFIFDCCASGLAFTPRGDETGGEVQQMIATLSGNGSRAVMTAGTANEKTFEVKDSRGRGNGVFTRAFLNVLSSGETDRKKDGFITIDEVIAEAKNEIASFAIRYNQKVSPRLWAIDIGNYKGTFVFVNQQAFEQGVRFRDDYAALLPVVSRGEVVGAYGIIKLISYVTGDIYIDDRKVGKIESGDALEYNLLVGSYKVEIKSTKRTYATNVALEKGLTTEITIPPEIENTPIKIRQPIFRSTPKSLSEYDVGSILKKYDFYCKQYQWNTFYSGNSGKGFENQYEAQSIKGGRIAIDHASGLMWQYSGSTNYMTYDKAKQWIKELNRDGYAGYHDWRLPTLEEAMSLMESMKMNGNLHIDIRFDILQQRIWTSDPVRRTNSAWIVNFFNGECYHDLFKFDNYVRAVRLLQSSTK